MDSQSIPFPETSKSPKTGKPSLLTEPTHPPRAVTTSSPSSPTHKPADITHYKRLVVCCDGTWQNIDAPYKPTDKTELTKKGFIPESNVVRIGRSLKKTAEVERNGKRYKVPQIIYYQNGVGSHYLTRLGAIFAGAVGGGVNDNVCEAYWFIANNWEENDEIFLFGFSRGAYTARAVSGLIGQIGILHRDQLFKFQDIYDRFMHRYKDLAAWDTYKSDLKQRGTGDQVKIKIVGVWDTVGSVGIPESKLVEWLHLNDKYKFHDTELSHTVENAFHALALDEQRYHFGPAVWYLSDRKDAANMKQCWFSGYHIDVGGGSASDPKHPDDNADISFAWMVDQCSPFLSFDDCVRRELIEANQRKPAPHDEGLTNYGIRKLHDSNVKIYKLETKQVRRPKQYTFQDRSDKKGKTLQHVITNETIHPSVRMRLLKADILKTKNQKWWQPYALADFQLTKCDPTEDGANGAEWKWVKEVRDKSGKPSEEIVIYEENIWKGPRQAQGVQFKVTSQDHMGDDKVIEEDLASLSVSEMMLQAGDRALLFNEAKSLQIPPVRQLGYLAWMFETIRGYFHK